MTEQSMAERIEAIKSLIRLYVHPANVREVMIENIDALAEHIARLERELVPARLAQETTARWHGEVSRRAEAAEAQIAKMLTVVEAARKLASFPYMDLTLLYALQKTIASLDGDKE